MDLKKGMFCNRIFAFPAQMMLTKTMQGSMPANICSENKNLKHRAPAAVLPVRNKKTKMAFIVTQQRSVEALSQSFLFLFLSIFLFCFVFDKVFGNAAMSHGSGHGNLVAVVKNDRFHSELQMIPMSSRQPPCFRHTFPLFVL